MRDLYFMRHGYIKSLAILCTVLLMSACDGLGGDTASGEGGTGSSGPGPGGGPGPGSGPGDVSAVGSVFVSWSRPTLRADETGLTIGEIAGYRIYYGQTKGNYPNVVDISDRTVTDITVNNIPVGSYFFVMTTLDLEGRESAFSSPAIQIQV